NLTVKQYPTGVPFIIHTSKKKPSSGQSKSEVRVEETKETRGKHKVMCFTTNEKNILPKRPFSHGYPSAGVRNAKTTVFNSPLTKSQSTDRLGTKFVNTQAEESKKGKHGGLKRSLPVHEVYFAEAASVIKLDFQNHLSLLPETKGVNVNSVMSSRTPSTRSFKTVYPYTYECILIKLKSSLGVEYMENSVEQDPPTPEGLTEFGQPDNFSDKNDDSRSIKELFQKDIGVLEETCSFSEEVRKSPLSLQPTQMTYSESKKKTLRATETQESISGPSSSLSNSGVPPGGGRPDNIENHEGTLENSSQIRPIWATDYASSSHQTASDKRLPIRRMINLFSRHGRWSNQHKSNLHTSLTKSVKSRTVPDTSDNPAESIRSRSTFSWKSKTFPFKTNHTGKNTLISLAEEKHDKSLQLPEGLLVPQTENRVKSAWLIERLQKHVCMAIRPLIAGVLFSSDRVQHIIDVTYRNYICRSLKPTENHFLISYQEKLCNPTPVLHGVESEGFEENRLVLFDLNVKESVSNTV
ncbi:hypothetical protein P879_04735, partial [Paragonimus westermani]